MTGHWLILGYAALSGMGALIFLRIIADELVVRERVLCRVETVLEEEECRLVAEVAATEHAEQPVIEPAGRYEIPPMPPPKRPS